MAAPDDEKICETVKLLQRWECVVLRVHADCVECEMHDLTDRSKPVEVAEVYLDSFSGADRRSLCEGAVFYWSIWHEANGTQVRRYSEFRVRRMPRLSRLTKREIIDRVKRLSERLLTAHNPRSLTPLSIAFDKRPDETWKECLRRAAEPVLVAAKRRPMEQGKGLPDGGLVQMLDISYVGGYDVRGRWHAGPVLMNGHGCVLEYGKRPVYLTVVLLKERKREPA